MAKVVYADWKDRQFEPEIVGVYLNEREGYSARENKERELQEQGYDTDEEVRVWIKNVEITGLSTYGDIGRFQYTIEEIRYQMGVSDLDDYFYSNQRETEMVMVNKGCIMDLDCIIAIQNALGRQISYEEYGKINETEIFDDMGLFNVTADDAKQLEKILQEEK